MHRRPGWRLSSRITPDDIQRFDDARDLSRPAGHAAPEVDDEEAARFAVDRQRFPAWKWCRT